MSKPSRDCKKRLDDNTASVTQETSGTMLHSVVPPRILGIIPARFASSRFPGKALALLAEKPMVQHVYERATMSRYLRDVLVATDDDRIASGSTEISAVTCA